MSKWGAYLPTYHKMGVVVPGGSSCANCRYARIVHDRPHCQNVYWQKCPTTDGGGGGQSSLPVADPRNYCCDVWEPKK